jgi:tetratricopeptide (TPR) repeat protein
MAFGFYLLVIVCLGAHPCLGDRAADQPSQNKPLTAEQKGRLKERDRYQEEANKCFREGKWDEGILALKKALAINRQVFGDLHEEVVDSLKALARAEESREDFAAARKVREEVLDLVTKKYGVKDWHVTDARRDRDQGDLRARLDKKSRQELRQAEEMDTKVGKLYKQGRHKEALLPAQQALAIHRRILSETHPDYAQSLNNLAALYRAMGDYPKALPLYEQARDLFRQSLGEGHPDYASSLHNLAFLHQAMGDYSKALPLYEQARDLRGKVLGKDHPDYAQSLNNLAALYRAMGDYPKALPLLEQARDIYRQSLGEGHPPYRGTFCVTGNPVRLRL